jgi:DNA-binding CsgD family transcriptional regulator
LRTPDFARHADALKSPDPVDRMKAHALTAITALVPAALTWFKGVGRRHHPPVVLQTGLWSLDPVALWNFGLLAERSRDATVLGLRDFDPEHRAFLSDHGIGDRAEIYLRTSGSIAADFALLRSVDEPPFTSAELAALRRLQPLLEHAFACAIAPETPDVHDLLRDSGLSRREADVAELVGRGATNQEIARHLHIGEATVKTHLTRVYGKVGVRTRTQLALLLGAQSEAPTTSV